VKYYYLNYLYINYFHDDKAEMNPVFSVAQCFLNYADLVLKKCFLLFFINVVHILFCGNSETFFFWII